jgi:hypothetical protein
MRPTKKKVLLSATLATLVAATVISYAAAGKTTPHEPGAPTVSRYEDWVPLQLVGGLESEPYRPIAELGQTADVVAIGRFTEFLEVRELGRPPAIAYELPVVFEPTRVLRGTVDGPLPVEFPVIGRTIEEGVAAYRKALIGPEFLLILRAKRFVGEEGRYRIVNTYGLWVATDRHALDAPMAEFDPWGKEIYASTLADARGSLAALASVAVSLPQLPPPPLPVPSPTADTSVEAAT